ncbi:class I adenylate-forming enzyme family protein [Gordonia sp. NPDC003429]
MPDLNAPTHADKLSPGGTITAAIHLADAGPPIISVARRLRAGAVEHPDRPLLKWLTPDGEDGLSWHEVVERATRRGDGIRTLAPAGGLVGIHHADRVEWITTYLACALSGLTAVPLSAGYTPAMIASRAELIGLDLVICDSELDTQGDFDTQGRVRACAVADVPQRPAHESIDVSPDSPLLVQFTSGTTGTPKAAVLSHHAALGAAHMYALGAGAGEGGVLFNPLPLDHVGGSVAGVLAAVAVGGTYLVVEKFAPDEALEVIRRLHPTVVGLVPTMIIDMLDRDDVDPDDFTSVVSVVGGATAVDPGVIDEIEERAGIRFLVGYGQSEAPCMALSGLSDSTTARTRTLGRPLGGRDYVIRDQHGAAVSVGEEGELYVRGPLIMCGYLLADGSVHSPVDADGWMATGDVCVLDAAGLLHFRARKREVIIRGGENIYPAHVESVITAMPGVVEAAVFGVRDERLGEVPVAAVRLDDSHDVDAEKLDAWSGENLPRSHRPVYWHIVDDFPRTNTGKIRKIVLAERFPRVD